MPGAKTIETDDVSGAARAAVDPDVDADPEPDEHHGDVETADNLDPLLEGEPAPREIRPAPARVGELANACVRFVAARYGVTLEYEADTLSFVDQWVRDARTELERRPEAADLVQSAAGAYLGEVIRQGFGGEWSLPDEMSDWRLCLSPVYCAFNPIGMMREALLLNSADGWHAHFELDPGEREGIEQRLASLPQVDADEYYAPSTRFDVVDIVVAALRADMQHRGLSDVAFDLSDYHLSA